MMFCLFFRYCKSANDVYRKAESLYQNQDEENAYILFMRYFFILSNIKKSYEFAHSKVSVFLFLLTMSSYWFCLSHTAKVTAELN